MGWENGGEDCGDFSGTKIRVLNTESTEGCQHRETEEWLTLRARRGNRTLMGLIGQMSAD